MHVIYERFLFIAVSPYDPNGQFSNSSLTRLEAANIPVVTAIEESLATTDINYMGPSLVIQLVFERSPRPTWKSLHRVLRELDLDDLSQEIEEHLNCK